MGVPAIQSLWGDGLVQTRVKWVVLGGAAVALGYALGHASEDRSDQSAEDRSDQSAEDRLPEEEPAQSECKEGNGRSLIAVPPRFHQRKKSMTNFVLDTVGIPLRRQVQLGIPGAIEELFAQVTSLEVALAAATKDRTLRDPPISHMSSAESFQSLSGLSVASGTKDGTLRDPPISRMSSAETSAESILSLGALPVASAGSTAESRLQQQKHRMSKDFAALMSRDDTSFAALVDFILASGMQVVPLPPFANGTFTTRLLFCIALQPSSPPPAPPSCSP